MNAEFGAAQSLKIQRDEITAHVIYKRLSSLAEDSKNKRILEEISRDELNHYEFWKSHTGTDVSPDALKVFFYTFVSRFLGLTFGIKLMESQEDMAQTTYLKFPQTIPDIKKIIQQEEIHEKELIDLIDEERLKYISSIVLGLNDALVELTGALAGLTLALQNARLIAVVGLITGIAASMSMAASEYLSTKHEQTEKNPLKASVYTGLAYIATVMFLIAPYFIFSNIFLALAFVLINALLVILAFTYYISVAKGFSLREKFLEMAGLSLSIATISFFIGWAIRVVLGVDV